MAALLQDQTTARKNVVFSPMSLRFALGIGCAMEMEPVNFLVDRPFLFFLRRVEDGSILFAGAVFDAAAAQR